MSRSMSGANNVPLGSRGGRDGALAAASASLGGGSLLNPDYLSQPAPRSSGGSKFGPPAANIPPPSIASDTGFGSFQSSSNKKLPNLDLIASINATLAKKGVDPPVGKQSNFAPPPQGDYDDEDSSSARKRKKRSRWGNEDPGEKLFIPGMPTILPSNLSKEQEEAYLLQLQIEDASRRLRTGDLGIPANPEERSPSPEPIYSVDGKRMNTREYRKRKELEEKRHDSIQKMLSINPDFKPPNDYKPPQIKVTDKVMIPQEEYPEINFVGLLIGPRGNTLKAMERDTGAKIIIRGKGSVKEGKVGRREGFPLPGEDEPLHAYITATNLEAVKKAVDRVKEVIKEGVDVPEGQNDLRKHQLRELALLNGTLREGEVPRCMNCGASDHKSWQCPEKPVVTNSIVCSACGGAGHIAKDCVQRRPGAQNFGPPPPKQNKIDEEYMSLMAELGEGPPPPGTTSSDGQASWQQGTGPGLFNRPGAPRALGGPSGGAGRGGFNGNGQGRGWNNGAEGYQDEKAEYGGQRAPGAQSSWGSYQRPPPEGRGWSPNSPRPRGPGPNQWSQQAPGGPPSYGMPPPFYSAPPPPGTAAGQNGSTSSWGWPTGPGPVPPPPPGNRPYWGGAPGGWPQGGGSTGVNLSSLIAAPPPPPPPPK